ncbi:sensor histidine kinase [Parachryseolinea silvisoli]|uniref:sensor histidine kinase n=1 Tax=Parachryseolinea silvisoli TaxID=2873601 RepID=UPI002265886E|nr:ATP-binding protein [Parachryseolinea silvisoli]MCD9017012.1 PAS domain-containing protein [Parachryseolinea silvisoli]
MDLSTLDFAQARTKHILFKTQLRSILYHGQTDQHVSSHTTCALGEWIYGLALAAYGSIPEVVELEKVHRDMHLAAAQLIDLYQQGRVEEARAGFTSVEIMAANLIMLLSVVENTIDSGQTGSDRTGASERLTISYEELQQLRKILHDLDERISEETMQTLRAREKAMANERKFQHSLMQIQVAEQRLRLAVEASDMGTFDWDLENQEFYSSPRLVEIFGFSANDVVTHQQLIAALHPGDLPIRERAIRTSFATGGLSYEARVVWPDSTVHWVRVHGKIVHNTDKKPLRMYGTVIDITQQKTFTESLEIKVKERTAELEKSNNALQKSNEELAQFAFVASHDLQEPLRKIQTFATRIHATETALTDRGKDYFRRMQQASMQMQQLIADVLSYSRMNATEQHVEVLELGGLLAKVQEQLSERIETVGATIEADALPAMKVIPYQFEQLLSNILSNALKYIKPGVPPRVVITADTVQGKAIDSSAVEGMYHRITITDNGIGFDPQYSERIFQVFQRLHGKNEYEGTGIGLAICKKIMDNHHGFITAAGEPGRGATFTIYLPM